ncbi:MAG: hypothetical protein ABI162_05190 [Luteolibacter sp.]
MFNIFKKLISKKPGVISLNDPDFGHITFDPSDSDPTVGIWQMDQDWEIPEDFAKVGCSSIPGTAAGPDDNARAFLLAKKRSLKSVWDLVFVRLEAIRQRWRPDTEQQDLRQVFPLTSLSLDEPMTDPPNCQVSFEPVGGKWIFASIQLCGDIITGDTIDT